MTKHQNPVLLLILALAVLAGPAAAQRKAQKATETKTIAGDTLDAAAFKALKWRNIGPFRGGRANAISGVAGNPLLYYAGYTGGGVWKTEDAGQNWRNISDGSFNTSSIGDIAVSEADPNVIYVGAGEHAVRGVMTTYGDGVYKSTDGGRSWKHLGLEKTRHISDVVIHPHNPDVVFIAAQGALHGPSPERGVYKSTDGGQTWKKTLYVDENTGCSSLSIDVTNPRILYAATWEHRRLPWQVVSGGPGSAIWKSTDGGETWKKIVQGLPGRLGKIGVSVSRANPSRVYAIVEAEKSKDGVYRSDDGGNSWTLTSNNQDLTSRSWYYMEVFADPVNADVVYVLNAPMMRSVDGGKTFSNVRVGHGDTHDLWINPQNNANLALADDGGAEISFNTGQSWSTLYNQPTAQFYRVNADKLFPYNVYGGQQDNTSVVIASRTNGGGITEKDWMAGPGCECAHIAFDPENPVLLYGGCYQGLIEVLDTRTNEGKDIMQYPSLNLAIEPRNLKYRYNWNAPIVASPHDPGTIYHTGNVVFRTTDSGQSWEVISPDLTRNDPAKQGPGGAPFTNEGAGGENYNTIYYLSESPLEKGVIYTGSDCGLVHVTRDNGRSWQNITPPNLPECLVQSIEVSPHAPGTAYIAATRYKFNDFSAMAYKTTDYGKTWSAINAGIQADDFLKVIREDPKTPGLLYGGAERGFYVSTDGGARWTRLQLNLPVVPVTDLIIRDNDLVAATAGRAFWILDDLGALQQSKGTFGDALVRLFQPKPTVRFEGGFSYRGGPAGQNPANGVSLDYYLAEKPDSSQALTLEILDARGRVLRSYSSVKDTTFKAYPGGPPPPAVLPAAKGVNRFAWDFRSEPLPDVPGAYVYGDYRGHRVAPGAYRARLSYRGQTAETNVEVRPDPRLKVEPADWTAQQDMIARAEGHIADIHAAINNLRRLKKQIETYNEVMKDMTDAKGIVDNGKELVKKIDAWMGNVIETRQKNGQDVINWPSRLNTEFFTVRSKMDAHDPRITQGVRQRLADLETEWAGYQQELKKLLDQDVQAYNQQFRAQNIPALILPE